jgi:hypothetical protein
MEAGSELVTGHGEDLFLDVSHHDKHHNLLINSPGFHHGCPNIMA